MNISNQIISAEKTNIIDTDNNIYIFENAKINLVTKEINNIKKPILDLFAHKSEATFASAHLWDDGIIDPRKTREVVALSLEIAMNAPVQETKFGVFRM